MFVHLFKLRLSYQCSVAIDQWLALLLKFERVLLLYLLKRLVDVVIVLELRDHDMLSSLVYLLLNFVPGDFHAFVLVFQVHRQLVQFVDEWQLTRCAILFREVEVCVELQIQLRLMPRFHFIHLGFFFVYWRSFLFSWTWWFLSVYDQLIGLLLFFNLFLRYRRDRVWSFCSIIFLIKHIVFL